MKEYIIRIGDIFTKQKAKELKEFLELKEITDKQKAKKSIIKKIEKWIVKEYGDGICCEDREIILKKLKIINN